LINSVQKAASSAGVVFEALATGAVPVVADALDPDQVADSG